MKANSHDGSMMSLAATFLLLFGFLAQAQNVYCVRAGATGANNGSDWNNAYSTLPANLQRGATYYIAAGTYAGYTFDDPVNFTNVITIKKATVNDHGGKETGWQSAYANGPAVFSGTVSFLTSYYVFDGVTGGGPGSWRSGHGFKVDCGDQRGIYSPHGWTTPVLNITIRHVQIQGNGGDQSAGVGIQIGDMNHNWTVSYCWVYDIGENLTYVAGDNAVFEYTYFGKYRWYTGHNEAMWALRGQADDNSEGNLVRNLTVRHCVIGSIYGTGGLGFRGDGFYFYGNVVYRETGESWGIGNGAIFTWGGKLARNIKVYNNTFIDCDPKNPLGFSYGVDLSGMDAKNNLFYSINDGDVNFGGFTHNHNHFVDSTGGTHGEASGTTGTGNPFVNWQNLDFRLTANTAPGTPLGSPYNTDMFGNPRATWTRGAVEFGSGQADTTPPAISNVQASSVSSKSAKISWVTDENSTSVVNYGTTTGYGSTISDASWVQSHSVVLANLTGNTTYHFRVQSSDGAGNTSTSGDFTFTTLISDVTPPSVNIVAPSVGALVTGIVSVAATASDNAGGSGIADVSLLVNNIVVVSDTSQPYQFAWNTSLVTNGVHALKARARDLDGNQSESSIVSVTVSNQAPTFTDGLVGFWRFDEGTGNIAGDFSGNGNTAVVFNNGANWGAGRLAGGLFLDGVDDYVTVPTSSSLESTINAVTVCAWVKIESSGQWQNIARKVLQDGTHIFPYSAYDLIVEDAGTPLPRMAVTRADGTRELVYGTTALSYGQWYHLAGVYDSTAVRIYVNGTEEGSTPFTGTLVQTGQPLLIGRNGAGGDLLRGVVDDLRVYGRALTSDEIQVLGNQSLPPPQVPPSNLRVASN